MIVYMLRTSVLTIAVFHTMIRSTDVYNWIIPISFVIFNPLLHDIWNRTIINMSVMKATILTLILFCTMYGFAIIYQYIQLNLKGLVIYISTLHVAILITTACHKIL